jgi:uncharacterized protein
MVVLHGAGNSCKKRGEAVCEVASSLGIDSIAFDFSGAGESTKNTALSVHKRTLESIHVIDEMSKKKSSIILCAFSMSGQSALDIIKQKENVVGIMLCSPAIYADDAKYLSFGPEFTRRIRMHRNWLESTSPANLTSYKGKVVLVEPEFDDVIPREIFEILETQANKANFLKINIENAPHTLGAWFNDNKDLSKPIIKKSLNFLIGN